MKTFIHTNCVHIWSDSIIVGIEANYAVYTAVPVKTSFGNLKEKQWITLAA
jgi:hypothetical protein